MFSLRHRHPQPDQLDDESPGDALLTTIDAALAFAATRELFTGEQVESMLTMVRLASGTGSHEPAGDAFEDVAAAFAGRALVASGELVDELLDARLRVAGTGPATRAEMSVAGDQPLVCT